MTEVHVTTTEHYSAVMRLLNRNPREIEIVTYSVGRVHYIPHDILPGSVLDSSLNFLGVALSRIQYLLEARITDRCTIVTTEPPQEVEVVDMFGKIKWKQHDSNHAKVWLFKYGRGKSKEMHVVALVGSRNLTSTVFTEITLETDEVGVVEDLQDIVESLIQQGVPLDGQQDWFSQVKEVDL